MAGGRIFLEPILQDTVGNIGESVDSVVTAVEPIPDKIDEQLEKLEAVADSLAGISKSVIVDKSDTNKTIELTNSSIDVNNNTYRTSSYVAGTTTTICSVKSYGDGTAKLHIPSFQMYAYSDSDPRTYTYYKITVYDGTTTQTYTSDEVYQTVSSKTYFNTSAADFEFSCESDVTYTISITNYYKNPSQSSSYKMYSGYLIDTNAGYEISYRIVNLGTTGVFIQQ